MKGHEGIIRMRMHRQKPDWIYIYDTPAETDWYETGGNATVSVHGDRLSQLDMRFVVGCNVHISGEDDGRVKRISEMCKRNRATVVASISQNWQEVWNGNDTERRH